MDGLASPAKEGQKWMVWQAHMVRRKEGLLTGAFLGLAAARPSD